MRLSWFKAQHDSPLVILFFCCCQSKGFFCCFCTHWFPRAMGKPGSDGVLWKRPASQVSSNDGPLLSTAAMAELKAMRNINDFRKRSRELGLVTGHQNSDGGWRHCSRAEILEACRRVRNRVPNSAGGYPALKRPASSTFGHELHSSKEAMAPLQSIVNINHFRQCVRALGVATQHRNAAGQWVYRHKADMLKDCRRLHQNQRRVVMRKLPGARKKDKASERPGARLKQPVSSTFGHGVSLSVSEAVVAKLEACSGS